MANQLRMALIDSIFMLHQRGWSQRRIARELGIDRATVARHLQQGSPKSKAAIAPLGSTESGSASKPAIAPLGSGALSAESKAAIAPLGSAASEAVPASPHGLGRPSD